MVHNTFFSPLTRAVHIGPRSFGFVVCVAQGYVSGHWFRIGWQPATETRVTFWVLFIEYCDEGRGAECALIRLNAFAWS